MTFKIVINPKTGKAETQTDANPDEMQKKLQETRKAVKDMISGNTTFHVDPNTPEPEKESIAPDNWTSTGYWGFIQSE